MVEKGAIFGENRELFLEKFAVFGDESLGHRSALCPIH
jgi:hypothetical protein